MTLPDERFRAVLAAHNLLYDLTQTKSTPRIPKEIRLKAWAVLRHYPTAYDMELASDMAPVVFQDYQDPLYNMVKKYDNDNNIVRHTCNACSCTYTDDEGGVEGDFGMLPMSFCPTCFSCMCDMVAQYMGYGEYEEDTRDSG